MDARCADAGAGDQAVIIVASQRSGACALADHLMNDQDNDHVTLSKIEGFMANDLHGALDEAHAVSKATQCKQFLFSVSLNPPEDVIASEEDFQRAADRVADAVGLSEQPYALVIHEKNGRRHAHVVWSRINADEMKAINLSHFKNKLRDVSRDLFLEHGWVLPKGLKTYGQSDPLSFSLSEWQQAQRIGVDAREMKQLFQEAWAQSDDLRSLNHALSNKGLYIATGDRRGVVALDIQGNVYALAKWTGIRTKEVKARLGDKPDLQSVSEVGAWLHELKTDQVKGYIHQIKSQHVSEMQPFYAERAELVTLQRAERRHLKVQQEKQWGEETKKRSDRVNKGIRGLFDRLTGAHRKTVKVNEREALECLRRDRNQRDRLIEAQMEERRDLQSRVWQVRSKQKKGRELLSRNIATYLRRPQMRVRREYRKHFMRGVGAREPSLKR